MSPLFGKQPKPFIDPARGDAEAARLRQAASRGDWRTVETGLAAAGELSRREFLSDAIAMNSTDLRWVDAWVRERPDSEAARLMWGLSAVQLGWQVRSGKAPEYVSAAQFKGFEEWLGNADEQLRHAAAIDSSDSAPLVGLLWCAVGLGLPYEMTRERWDEAFRRNPATELGALAYTTFISPRWNGTPELMWDFVHGLLASEPPGGPRWALVPNAHLEQWVAARMKKLPGSAEYFKQPGVQREIIDAHASYLGSPSRRPGPLEPQYRGLFAGCFYLMDARDLLRGELQQLGPGIQNIPWGYLGSAVDVFEKARKTAGL